MTVVDTRKIESASLTSIGRVRTTNQDYFGEFVRPSGDRLFVVADGMGGHRGGATASRLATEVIGEVFTNSTANSPDTLYDALAAANERVHRTAREDPELRGMGTTVVSVLFDAEGLVWVAHVGDSRAYRLHAAGMEQITQDHSVVGEMVRRGLITSREAEIHPRRNEILRSVGVEQTVEIDVARVLSAPGDFYILCSDGLSGPVSDPEIAEVVRSAAPTAAAKRLIDMANARGAPDNVTVQIALLPLPDEETLLVEAPPSASADASASSKTSSKLTTLIGCLAGALALLAAAYFLIGANSKSTNEGQADAAMRSPDESVAAPPKAHPQEDPPGT